MPQSDKQPEPNPKDELETVRREQILQAAVRAFGRKGYHASTVKDIAREAGLAPGTLYLYFENKRAILTGFFEYAIRVAHARAKDYTGMPLDEALTAFLAERLAFLRDHINLVRVIFTESLFDDELREKIREFITGPVDRLIGDFLASHTEAAPSAEQVRTVARSLQGQLIFWAIWVPLLEPDRPHDAQQDAARIASIILNGIQGVLEGS